MTTNTYHYRPYFKVVSITAFLGLGVMVSSVVYAFLTGSLLEEGAVIMAMPWGLVSIVDLYLGLILFCFWIIRRETFCLRGILWVLLVLILGNMISCLYIIKACIESNGDIYRFWLGGHDD